MPANLPLNVVLTLHRRQRWYSPAEGIAPHMKSLGSDAEIVPGQTHTNTQEWIESDYPCTMTSEETYCETICI